MEEILERQRDGAQRMTGKDFLLGVAVVVLKLSAAQILCNLAISLTGVGLLNTLFYLYAVLVLIRFMQKSVAGCVYTLRTDTLVLERQLGDSTTTLVQVPLEAIRCIHPVLAGERLRLSYRQVTVIDPRAKASLRIRAGIVLSLFSAHLARLAAGKQVGQMLGHVVVFDEDKRVRACVFRPDETMCAALADQLGERFGWDERLARPKNRSLWARALNRAFPALYPYVTPLLDPQEVRQAEETLKRQKEERKQKQQARSAAQASGKRGSKGAGRTAPGKAKAKQALRQENAQADADGTAHRRRKQTGDGQ